jgi:hypothetical protein
MHICRCRSSVLYNTFAAYRHLHDVKWHSSCGNDWGSVAESTGISTSTDQAGWDGGNSKTTIAHAQHGLSSVDWSAARNNESSELLICDLTLLL